MHRTSARSAVGRSPRMTAMLSATVEPISRTGTAVRAPVRVATDRLGNSVTDLERFGILL